MAKEALQLAEKEKKLERWMEKDVNNQITSLLEQSGISYERFFSVTVNAFRNSPKLLECTTSSLKVGLIQAVTMGLEINSPVHHAALVPFGRDAVLIPMYEGYIHLAISSGHYSNVFARIVYENDLFVPHYGTDNWLEHEPCWREDPGEALAVYAVFETVQGVKDFVLMRKDEVEKRKKAALARVRNPEATPWVQWEDEMWKKTAVRALSKYMVKSPRLALAREIDNRVETGGSTKNVIDVSGFGVDVDEREEAEFEQEPEGNKGKQRTNKEQTKEDQPEPGKSDGKIARVKGLLRENKIPLQKFVQFCNRQGIDPNDMPDEFVSDLFDVADNGNLQEHIEEILNRE